MAKYVCENPPPPGNYGLIQVYIDRGITCARVPNPLEGERVKSAPEFANTRKHAGLFAQAAPLAAVVHRTLPENRQRTHYQKLAGKAYQWLKAGKSREEVQLLLPEAAEEMRKELKQQRIKALIAERRKERKPVFSIPAVAIPALTDMPVTGCRTRRTRRHLNRLTRLHPGVGGRSPDS